MLADDEFLAGGNINESLRGNGMETSSAGVSICTIFILREQAHHCKMVVCALADALVCADCTFVKLGNKSLAPCYEFLLLRSGRFGNGGKLRTLGFQIRLADRNTVVNTLNVLTTGIYGFASLSDILLGDSTKKPLILELFIYGIIFAAIGNILEFLAILFDFLVKLVDMLLDILYSLIITINHLIYKGILGIEGLHLGFKCAHFLGKLSAKLKKLVYLNVCVLKFVKSLQFLLYKLLVLRKILAKRHESLALVDRSRYVYFFLDAGHIYLYFILQYMNYKGMNFFV